MPTSQATGNGTGTLMSATPMTAGARPQTMRKDHRAGRRQLPRGAGTRKDRARASNSSPPRLRAAQAGRAESRARKASQPVTPGNRQTPLTARVSR